MFLAPFHPFYPKRAFGPFFTLFKAKTQSLALALAVDNFLGS